ncbi:MAG: hypothetical protein HC765_11660 [Brachymonas sp.]|nr:hypothetical protein [Brachymonas sp.]
MGWRQRRETAFFKQNEVLPGVFTARSAIDSGVFKTAITKESALKRWLYLLFGLALFGAIILFGNVAAEYSSNWKIYLVLAIVLILVPWGMYGERLSQKDKTGKAKKRAQEIGRQSEWNGVELIVGYRWLKALFFIALYGVCFVLLMFLILGVELSSSANWTFKGAIGFSIMLFLLLFTGCATWSWLAGLVAAIFHGFSVRVNANGFHLSGLPSLPFAAISRVGFREQVSRHGSITSFLVLELNQEKKSEIWRSPWRALLAGYIFLFMSYFRPRRDTTLFQIHARHWKAAAPTIAAAIRRLSEKSGQFPVVAYSPWSTPAESREEHRLFKHNLD